MSKYYGQEDDVETPETQLANYRAQIGAADAVVVWSKEQLNSFYNKANTLFNAAVERGDEKAQGDLTEMVKLAEHIHQNMVHTNAAHKSVLEAAAVLSKQKQQAESDYDEIMDAIEDEDTNHPTLKRFATYIETVTRAEVDEDSYDRAIRNARSEVWDEVSKAIKKLVPRSQWIAVYQFVSALDGEMPLNDIQLGLLISLIQTFTVEEAAQAS